MARTIELSLPDSLMESAKRHATLGGRDVAQQLLHDIADINDREKAEEKLLEQIRDARDAMAARGIHASDELLQEARSWGRK